MFRLGLVGFSDRDQQLIRAVAAQYRQVHWRSWAAEGADAWLLHGARVARLQDGRARVVTAQEPSGAPAFLVDVRTRPTAYAAPAPLILQQALPHAFELGRPETLLACLAALDRELARLRRMYWVASQLVTFSVTGKAVHELRAGTQLLAVADMKGAVWVSPEATEPEFARASWTHRARKLVDVPEAFEHHTLAEALWIYATRTRAELLPGRYTQCRIFLRRPPRVRSELVEDVHLRIIRELAAAPATMPELLERTGTEEAALAHGLAALYYVGAITSNPERVWAASQQAGMWSSRASLMPDSLHAPSRLDGQPSTTPLH